MAKADNFCNRAEAYEAHDNVPLSPADHDAIGNIMTTEIAKFKVREARRYWWGS